MNILMWKYGKVCLNAKNLQLHFCGRGGNVDFKKAQVVIKKILLSLKYHKWTMASLFLNCWKSDLPTWRYIFLLAKCMIVCVWICTLRSTYYLCTLKSVTHTHCVFIYVYVYPFSPSCLLWGCFFVKSTRNSLIFQPVLMFEIVLH